MGVEKPTLVEQVADEAPSLKARLVRQVRLSVGGLTLDGDVLQDEKPDSTPAPKAFSIPMSSSSMLKRPRPPSSMAHSYRGSDWLLDFHGVTETFPTTRFHVPAGRFAPGGTPLMSDSVPISALPP